MQKRSVDSDTDVTDGTEEDESQWTEIERKKLNVKKKKERKRRTKQRMEDLAKRIKHMVGIGPIPQESIEHFEKNHQR